MGKKAKQRQSTGSVDGAAADGAGAAAENAVADEGPSIKDLEAAYTAAVNFVRPTDGPAPLRGPASPEDIAAQVPELVAALRTLRQRSTELRQGAQAALERFTSAGVPGAAPADSPAQYVDMKVQVMLSYLVGLLYYALLKVEGVPVREHPVVPHLLWLQTLLQKLKPIDQRLQYQITKLLEWADANDGAKSLAAGAAAGDDLRALRPGELAATVEDEDGEETPGAKAPADNIYRPPKIAQVDYTKDHISLQEKTERELERKRSRLERSEFMRSLREEFTDAPTEVRGDYKTARAERTMRRLAEQQAYEEEAMTRIRMKKAEQKAIGQALREGRLSSGGAVSLDDAVSDFHALAGLNSRSKGGKGGKGGKRGRSGTPLQEYQDAVEQADRTRRAVSSAFSGAGNRKGGGKGKGGTKRKHH